VLGKKMGFRRGCGVGRPWDGKEGRQGGTMRVCQSLLDTLHRGDWGVGKGQV
jgi:hypothetical protein